MTIVPWSTTITVTAVAIAILCVGALFRRRGHIGRLEQERQILQKGIWDLRAAAEARTRAEAASEAKSRFLATVSHEVRTPLNGILGIADLLTATPLTREQQAYVAAMSTSGRALMVLIDEILDFARIESGRLDLEPAAFDVNDLVEGVVELLAPQAQDKGLEIASFLDPNVPQRLVGDAPRLRQVLLNLAGNAVKFTETGGVGVRIVATPLGSVRFSVHDTGPGIPPERRAAIFEEFEQVDGSTTRRHGGTGLGLAIAKRIIVGMGGTLALTDRDGCGSIFGFTLDLPADDETKEAANTALPRLAGQRMLIVSGDTFQPAYLADWLQLTAAQVVRAASEAEALTHLEQGGFDLAFVDCGLGELVARRLARAARKAGISRTVLLFSPFERRNFGQHLLGGFDAWLVKPVRRTSLAERLVSRPRGPNVGAPQAWPTGYTGVQVLLAEDNPVNAMIAKASLERLGAVVTHASDGAAALAEAEAAIAGRRAPFDLILMDICMPQLDGFETARLIRAAEAKARTPGSSIVAMTAHTFEATLHESRQAGIDRVLTKPVAPDDFRNLVVALNRQPAAE